MAAAPPLSVLLPVRNGAAHLVPALESVFAQSYSSFEIVAVDDGSEDATPHLLRDLALRDSRLRVLSQEARGIVSALELARSRAEGRYLARMDADDVALPERFERQMELVASERRIVVCGTGISYFPRNVVRAGARRYEAWINALVDHESMERDLFVECPIPHPTLLVRADVLELLGGYRDRGWPEDYDLILRLWEAGARFGKVPEVLLRWREGRDRLSRTDAVYSSESFLRCKVHFLLRTHLRNGRRVMVWGAGPVGKAFARELLRQGGRLVAFADLDPRKVGQEIHGVPVVHPDGAYRYTDVFSVAAVAQPGARDEIREDLTARGRRQNIDFVAVA
jgi:glycosyltransferase involved in cell wall biosynthesis